MASFSEKIVSLQQAATDSPEYAEILPFFIELFRYLDKEGASTGITFSIPENHVAERTANGFPLIAPDYVQVDRQMCTVFLGGVVELLKRIGRDGEAELGKIAAALREGGLDPALIFQGILERKRVSIDEAAASIAVPAPLIEYIFEIPLKAALELLVTTIGPDAFPQWQESFCPVCGSRAGMAELSGEEGKRYLCCSACTFRWPFKRLQCPYCGTEETDKLSYFTADDGVTRVDTCTACSRYIKTRDSRKTGADRPLELEDMLTIHLDLVAAREGFERGK